MDIVKETEWLIKASKYIDLNLQNKLGLRLAFFYELLPEAFTTQQANLVGCALKYSPRMVSKNLSHLSELHFVERISRSLYSKSK